MSQDRVNAAHMLQEAMLGEKWYVSVGDTGGELILYVTSVSKAKQKLDNPKQWHGFPLVIRKSPKRHKPLRGGIGNQYSCKE